MLANMSIVDSSNYILQEREELIPSPRQVDLILEASHILDKEGHQKFICRLILDAHLENFTFSWIVSRTIKLLVESECLKYNLEFDQFKKDAIIKLLLLLGCLFINDCDNCNKYITMIILIYTNTII